MKRETEIISTGIIVILMFILELLTALAAGFYWTDNDFHRATFYAVICMFAWLALNKCLTTLKELRK